ncbi:MAG: EFR1 family ferrodoxin [Clostridiales Family XIII bacterium]|jgi:Pyruvate/2-oxoacid:ferredoxin oxidoreductase delta subunit/flavodoxin|nr:EFR1 family ferrodoxin [Clostridiales Family XIII bacterium]
MHRILYFTGTGNCLRVAGLLKEKFGDDTDLLRVCSETAGAEKEEISGTLGIVYPVYSGNMPIMLKTFLDELSVDPQTYVYAVAVHGGMPGRTSVYMESVFQQKQMKLAASFQIRLPHNGILLFDAEPEARQKLWLSGLPARILEISDAVKEEMLVAGGSSFPSLKKMAELGLKIPKGFAPPNVQTAPNTLFDPALREKDFWTDDRCSGCGICVKVCPAANIQIREGKPEWLGHCENCVACFQWCPEQSIQYKEETKERRRYHNPDVELKEILI